MPLWILISSQNKRPTPFPRSVLRMLTQKSSYPFAHGSTTRLRFCTFDDNHHPPCSGLVCRRAKLVRRCPHFTFSLFVSFQKLGSILPPPAFRANVCFFESLDFFTLKGVSTKRHRRLARRPAQVLAKIDHACRATPASVCAGALLGDDVTTQVRVALPFAKSLRVGTTRGDNVFRRTERCPPCEHNNAKTCCYPPLARVVESLRGCESGVICCAK